MTYTRDTMAVAVRSFLLVIIGLLLRELLGTLVAYAMIPDLSHVVLYQINPRLMPNVQGLEEHIRHSSFLLRYVADPVAGFGVGCFLGFFQKSRPALVATICWTLKALVIIPGTNGAFLLTRIAPGELLTLACSIAGAIGVKHVTARLSVDGGHHQSPGSVTIC